MHEEAARRELIEYARLIWDRRLTSGSSGNLSARLDDGDLLVTPASSSFRSLETRDLVRVSPKGNARNPALHPTSELPLHLAAYRVRPDIRYVVHTHPTFSVVWSKAGRLFPRDTVGSMESLGACAWTPYRKNGTEELAELCAAEFGRGAAVVVMERHGLTAVDETLDRAFVQTDLAEEASRIAYFSALLFSAPELRERLEG